MKSILISIKPEWVAKILSGEKTVEVRKTAPKCELPVTVYVYCTKKGRIGETLIKHAFDGKYRVGNCVGSNDNEPLNGKVVAKFTLNKVERFIQGLNEDEYERLPNFALQDYDYYGLEYLMEKACLNDEEINEYAPDLSFYAWHISDLEIFDEPMELDGFDYPCPSGIRYIGQRSINGLPSKKRPPQSFCYIEVEERK